MHPRRSLDLLLLLLLLGAGAACSPPKSSTTSTLSTQSADAPSAPASSAAAAPAASSASAPPQTPPDCEHVRVLDLDREGGACRGECPADGCKWILPRWLDLSLHEVTGRAGDILPFQVKLTNHDAIAHELLIVDDPIVWQIDVLANGKPADLLPPTGAGSCPRYFPNSPARITMPPRGEVTMPLKVIASMKEETSCDEAYEPPAVVVRKPSVLYLAKKPIAPGHYRLRVSVPFWRAPSRPGMAPAAVVLETDMTVVAKVEK